MLRRTTYLTGLAALLLVGCTPPDQGRPDFVARAYLRLVDAEDARPAGGPRLDLLLQGKHSPSATLRAVSVRGLGRLENPDRVQDIAPALADPSPVVRREAANALAQAVHGEDGSRVLPILLHAAASEADPTVLGAVARSLGRLSLPAADDRRAAEALVDLSRDDGYDAPPYQMEGVALGMASWIARARRRGDAAPPLAFQGRLRDLTRYGVSAPAGDRGAARVRGVAAGAYLALAADEDDVEALLNDPAEEVRRVAAAALGRLTQGPRLRLGARALSDPRPQVRVEAVRRGLAVPPLTQATCRLLADAATADDNAHVRLAALDALSHPCPASGEARSLLTRLARGLPASGERWHESAHALAALAAVDPQSARPILAAAEEHTSPFARAWVATAAGTAADVASLRRLSGDASPNVRTVALQGLAATQGRAADATLIQALGTTDDNQLLFTVAQLLHGAAQSPAGPAAAAAALDALERISSAGLETLRDSRVALLTLAGQAGDASLVPRVEPRLRDYDPAVALEASRVLQAWTGKRWIDAPRGSPRLPLPTPADLRAMERTAVVLHMARGGSVRIRLLPWQAPTNAARLYHMVADGALDGLTFHRVVPNFVLQGGSPGANEYAGHGAYTRDELGLASNWRGTVGLSTRGRDTGDGQIYVNLVDNIRLDHDYTVYGVVTVGMDVLDGVLEGDVIERAELESTAGPEHGTP